MNKLTIAEEEERTQLVALREVLELHPRIPSETELIQVLGGDLNAGMKGIEPWKLAINALCEHGLLRIDGASVSHAGRSALR